MQTLWQIILTPFKWCWYLLNFVREFILNVFFIIFIVFLITIYLRTHSSLSISTKKALIMDLTGVVVDKPITSNNLRQLSYELLGSSNSWLRENSLFDLVDILRHAKNDTNITGLVLLLKNFSGTDQVSLQYIGKALKEFHDSGKPIYAVGDKYTQAQYFLASFADKIYLTTDGVVDIHGIATNKLYYKTLFKKLKIHSHIFRVGTYKSAVEPLLLDYMSFSARKAESRWLSKLWQNYLSVIAYNRGITPQKMFPGASAILNGLRAVGGNTAQFALDNKWVDEVASISVIDEFLIKAFGWNEYKKTFNGVSIYNYKKRIILQEGMQIAVIFVNGAIIDGSEVPGLVGADTVAFQIRHARLDSNIKAIVLRVNSPGGSVTASEIIRSELAAVRNSGKPIVVSMGGMAASGGYWISTPANYIIASANTLTGSIGIFSIINTIEDTLNIIGVHSDGVATSPLADKTITKNISPEFSQLMQISVENGYRKFISLVSHARHKSIEEIDKISQGRVWIGSDAVRYGLIDELGDFDSAVNKAAELAKLKKYQLNWYSSESGLLEQFLSYVRVFISIFTSNFIQSLLFPSFVMEPTEDILAINNFIINFRWNDPQNRYAFCLIYKPFLY